VSLIEDHVRDFNHGVDSGDWSAMLARFSDDAELHFVGPQFGPFVGRAAIARAYAETPPDDRIILLADDRFAWERGGSGRLVLEHDGATIRRLTVIFD
jgi:hypothetical protein